MIPSVCSDLIEIDRSEIQIGPGAKDRTIEDSRGMGFPIVPVPLPSVRALAVTGSNYQGY
jgi:hypothetical protein